MYGYNITKLSDHSEIVLGRVQGIGYMNPQFQNL